METAKKIGLLLFALAAGAFLLIGGLFSVISGTVADLATAPPPVPAQDRVAFWYPYIAGAAHGLDPVQLVDSIMSMSSQGNVAKDSLDGKNVGLMWIPKADGQNLGDPANNIIVGVSILGPYKGGDYQGYIDSYFKKIGQTPAPETKTVYDIKGNPRKVPVYPDYTKAIFDVWVGNSDTTGNGDTYKVDGADATVLAIAQGPDGTSTSSKLSTKPITWPTIRLPDYVQPDLPVKAKVLPRWAQEVTWGQAFYGPANPSSGNYLLYPGMYVYEIDIKAKSKDVKEVSIPFEAVWLYPIPGSNKMGEIKANASVTIDFNSSGTSSGSGGSGGGGGGSTVYTSPKALQFKPVDPSVIASYLSRYDSAFTSSDISTIISAAQAHGLNPLLLLAITGQEQAFDNVNNDTPDDIYRIEQNPFNVSGSWENTDYPLAVSADIVANFLAERLSQAPPSGENAIQWINDPTNPNGGLYASEADGSPTPGWWEGVNYFFNQMNGLSGVYTSQSGSQGTGASPGKETAGSGTGSSGAGSGASPGGEAAGAGKSGLGSSAGNTSGNGEAGSTGW